MHWVVQNNMYAEEGFNILISTLKRFNIPHSTHKVVPFIRKLSPDINPAGKVIVMGTYSIAYIARDKGWSPGAFINDNLNYGVQCEKWPNGTMLNDDAWNCRFVDVPEMYKPFFIRPVDDGKCFAGEIMDWPSFKEWQTKVLALSEDDNPHITADTMVMVCTKKELWVETRLWIIDNKVVTASEYKRGTLIRYKSHVDERVVEYAEKIANSWSPCRAYVMDVTDTPEGLKVIEVNNLNSAGFYKADIQKLVLALEEAFN